MSRGGTGRLCYLQARSGRKRLPNLQHHQAGAVVLAAQRQLPLLALLPLALRSSLLRLGGSTPHYYTRKMQQLLRLAKAVQRIVVG